MRYSDVRNRLETMLLMQGWYLHIWEVLNKSDGDLIRMRIRFPCRGPVDYGYMECSGLSMVTAEDIFDRIYRFVHRN